MLPAQQRGKCLVVVLTQTRHTGSLAGISAVRHECEFAVALLNTRLTFITSGSKERGG
jgi:hypothetical protein